MSPPRGFPPSRQIGCGYRATGQVEDRPPTPEEQGKDLAAAALGRKGGADRAKVMSPQRRAEGDVGRWIKNEWALWLHQRRAAME
jgi:hypothetical protein